jgi:hypothetical protein
LSGDKCHRLTRYHGRKLQIKGPTLEAIPNLPISIGEFSTEIQNIDSISEMAKIIDHYQLHIWKILSNSQLPDEKIQKYTEELIASVIYMTQLSLAFEIYRDNPKELKKRVEASFKKLEEFESAVRPAPELINTGQELRRHRAISDAFSSIGVDEKEANQAVIVFADRAKNRVWSVENREAQVLEENEKLITRLMKVITQKNLNSQLSNDRPLTISELVNIVITKRVIPTEGRSREFADRITKIGERVARQERITQEEFEDYTLAIVWFDDLEDMQRQQEELDQS